MKLVFDVHCENEAKEALTGDSDDCKSVAVTCNLVSDHDAEKRYLGNSLGPWVVGIYLTKHDLRFELVPDRQQATLVPLIKHYVEGGSTVVTDCWQGYSSLTGERFQHETVNHSRNFVNPDTGFHTQAIERAWVKGKAKMRRTCRPKKRLKCIWTGLLGEHHGREITQISCLNSFSMPRSDISD